jgi:type I restriction enzyme, S subunit
MMTDRSKYKRAVKGDLAYNMMRMWQGAVGVAPEDGLISPAYVVATPRDGTNAGYYSEASIHRSIRVFPGVSNVKGAL